MIWLFYHSGLHVLPKIRFQICIAARRSSSSLPLQTWFIVLIPLAWGLLPVVRGLPLAFFTIAGCKFWFSQFFARFTSPKTSRDSYFYLRRKFCFHQIQDYFFLLLRASGNTSGLSIFFHSHGLDFRSALLLFVVLSIPLRVKAFGFYAARIPLNSLCRSLVWSPPLLVAALIVQCSLQSFFRRTPKVTILFAQKFWSISLGIVNLFLRID